jgi:hypothetical protein
MATGCFGRPAPINVKYIKTVVEEDSSGTNTFRLAKPVKCEALDFRPALDEFKSQFSDSGGNVIVSNFNDGVDAGWEVTVNFDSPEQIPAQIEGLKRSIVLTVKNNWTGTFSPDWDSLIATNENEFSVNVDRPASTGQGKEWRVAITVSPGLLTTPEADCSYPEIQYEIVMPGTIGSHEVSIKAYSGVFETIFRETMGGTIDKQLMDYAVAQKTHTNTLLWTIRPKSIGEIMLENDGIDLEQLNQTTDAANWEAKISEMLYEHLQSNQADRSAVERLFGQPIQSPDGLIVLILLKPIYTIKVNSATTLSPTQFLVNNITPIVVLIGGLAGAIYTIINIRQAILKRKEKM